MLLSQQRGAPCGPCLGDDPSHRRGADKLPPGGGGLASRCGAGVLELPLHPEGSVCQEDGCCLRNHIWATWAVSLGSTIH